MVEQVGERRVTRRRAEGGGTGRRAEGGDTRRRAEEVTNLWHQRSQCGAVLFAAGDLQSVGFLFSLPVSS